MDVQKLIDEYAQWLKSEITFERVGEYYEITTPYLDNANDYLQIYVRQEDDNICFTDDGNTINALRMSGFQLNASRNQHIADVLNQFGIHRNKDELCAKAPIRLFAQKKHMFIQAMLRISDLASVSRQRTQSLFSEDIQLYFDQNDIFPSENVQFAGKSGFSHSYDYLFTRTRTKPERLCQAVNNPSRSSFGNIMFAWDDTKAVRRPGSQLIVILNDRSTISQGIEDGYENYGVHVIRWSERNQRKNIDLLTA